MGAGNPKVPRAEREVAMTLGHLAGLRLAVPGEQAEEKKRGEWWNGGGAC